ncbi:MAG: hypothetical protein FJ108_17495 [Deltaproteobacteria bacterium]|nr:hypothetical protein [Deltaproteobacteria bacterium]
MALWMWFAGFPVAVAPLWQVAQAPVTEAWSNRAGVQAVVVWQSSQVLALWMWFAGLPVAVVPLWQVAQVPVTEAWSKEAGIQAVVE